MYLFLHKIRISDFYATHFLVMTSAHALIQLKIMHWQSKNHAVNARLSSGLNFDAGNELLCPPITSEDGEI